MHLLCHNWWFHKLYVSKFCLKCNATILRYSYFLSCKHMYCIYNVGLNLVRDTRTHQPSLTQNDVEDILKQDPSKLSCATWLSVFGNVVSNSQFEIFQCQPSVHGFLVLIGASIILSKNKDYAYILPTYVLLSISCVDLCWNIVGCRQQFKDYTHQLMHNNCWKTKKWFLLFVPWILCFNFSCILHLCAIILFELFWLDVFHP